MIKQVIEFVKEKLGDEVTGHDFWHAYRVYKLALTIAEAEKDVDIEVVSVAALVHDLADEKIQVMQPAEVEVYIRGLELSEDQQDHVLFIINHMSFSKELDNKEVEKTKEFMIVQDADRLDAIGTIGIARTFAYGAKKGRPIYNPDVPPNNQLSKQDYLRGSHTINHFYEKLLLLKEKMNTPTAKKIATKRHATMVTFLDQFHEEWEGKR